MISRLYRVLFCIAIIVCAEPLLLGEEVSLVKPASERFRNEMTGEIPDFQRHVIPLIGRLGCNTRSCHGSFQGRGGMALSLFGYDFEADLNALTAQAQSESSRRIDQQNPADSLVLLKATNRIDHEGGKRVDLDSWQFHLLKRWIAAGTPGVRSSRSVKSLTVEPSELNWTSLGESRTIRVEAIWTDGVCEDVTCLTRFRVNDDSVASVDSDGAVTAIGHGDSHLIAFYDNAVAAIPIVVSNPTIPTVAWPNEKPSSQIDEFVNARLKSLKLVPSALCNDSEFIRRASIDLTGTLPHPDEVKDFIADKSADKRERKIDELLQRPAMAAWWANKLCDFTGCNPQQQAELGQEFAEQWYMWLYDRLRENKPYDEIVEGIFLSTGREVGESYKEYAEKTSAYFREKQPEAFSQRSMMQHYWSRRTLEKPSAKALAVAHSFLGIRLQCAECHKHPFDRWTKMDFHQFSRFFEDIQYGVSPDSKESYQELASRVGLRVGDKGQGTAINPEQLAKAKSGETIPWREVYLRPRQKPITLELLGVKEIELQPNDDPRRAIMEWMRSPENPWFAKAIVNRVWASCFHVGIVDPSDDLNPANPPSNPELLDWLSSEFVRKGYDLRWLLREIALSNTWQRSTRPNETNLRDKRNFSHMLPRRLPAEVLYDSMKQVLCSTDKQSDIREDLPRRAVGHLSMRMAGTYAMHVFGKPERAVACDCERVNQPSLLQSIFLQNDPMIHLFLNESGWLKELRLVTTPNEQVLRQWITEAWLRAYSRTPTADEMDRSLKHLYQAQSPVAGMEDLVWSLFNTKEFLLNH